MLLMVVGCNGFLGSSMCRFGVRSGFDVVGVGRSSKPVDWEGEYVQQETFSCLHEVIQSYSPGVLVHTAGPASVSSSFVDPRSDFDAGVLTWVQTLEAVRRSAVQPLVVFPSSAAVYGNPHCLPVSEDAALAPISPYGFHKVACELLAREYATCFGLDIVICRFFSLIGERQRRLLVWELYKQFTSAEPVVRLNGAGAESRDYLHVDDAISGAFDVMTRRVEQQQHDHIQQGSNVIVNIASGEERSIREVAEEIRELTAPEKRICWSGKERPGDPQHWRADITRLRTASPAWRPKPFSVGLQQCVSAWRKQHV
jgi:UDP-glucose 4-epimerase